MKQRQDSFYPRLSLTERDRRWAAARNFMVEHQMEALLAFGERDASGTPQFLPDIYLTGKRAGATVLVPLEGDPILQMWVPIR